MVPAVERALAVLRDRRAHLLLRRCDSVGEGARVVGVPTIRNAGKIYIGRGFAMTSIPVLSHLATGPEGVIRIGNDVRVAHGAAVTAHSEVTIGDGTIIGPFAMILDIDFHEVNDRGSQGTARPVRIGRDVTLGAGVVVLRGAIIGDGAVVEPNAVVSRAVPPGARVAGVPARPVAIAR